MLLQVYGSYGQLLRQNVFLHFTQCLSWCCESTNTRTKYDNFEHSICFYWFSCMTSVLGMIGSSCVLKKTHIYTYEYVIGYRFKHKSCFEDRTIMFMVKRNQCWPSRIRTVASNVTITHFVDPSICPNLIPKRFWGDNSITTSNSQYHTLEVLLSYMVLRAQCSVFVVRTVLNEISFNFTNSQRAV